MPKTTLLWALAALAVALPAQCVHAPARLTFASRPSPFPPLLPVKDCSLPQQVVGAKPEKGSPGHIFFIIPAYNVEYIKNVPPMSPREKWDEFISDTYDPIGLSASAFEAAVLEHDHTGFCGYGHGWGGFGKCYGAALLDGNVSGVIGDFLLPSLWHQDPRYFRLGQGSVGTRLLYALSRVFIARSDAGGWTFASAATTGTIAAGAISNLYYPKSDRGWGLSLSRMGIDLGGTAIFDCEAEFWPDIVHWITGK